MKCNDKKKCYHNRGTFFGKSPTLKSLPVHIYLEVQSHDKKDYKWLINNTLNFSFSVQHLESKIYFKFEDVSDWE